MCFSPEGDLIGGLVVTAIGVDACLHLRGRPEYRMIAPFPILLGLHQIDETFVWWQLQGHVPHAVGIVAMWIYLLFAFVVLPTLVPTMVLLLEPRAVDEEVIAPFPGLGRRHVGAAARDDAERSSQRQLGSYHVAYTIGLQHGVIIIGLYIVATCGSMLASGLRNVVWFGAVNLVAVIVLARLCANGFASLWCFYAALACGAIALHMRFAKTRPKRRSPILVSSQTRFQSGANVGPFGLENGVHRGVAREPLFALDLGRLPVTEHAFELSADSLDCSSGAFVALVSLEVEAANPPDVEGVGHHEQLRVGVGRGSLSRSAEERAADLDGVRILAIEVPPKREEPRHADDR